MKLKASRNTPSYKSFYATVDKVVEKLQKEKINPEKALTTLKNETKRFKKQYAL